MKKHKILNWTARITGLLILGFFLLFFIGEGVPDIVNGRGKELLRFLPFTLPSIIGFIIAWRRPATGGWLMIAGAFVMGSYFLYFNDIRVALIYGIPSLIVGLCFLAAEEKVLV